MHHVYSYHDYIYLMRLHFESRTYIYYSYDYRS